MIQYSFVNLCDVVYSPLIGYHLKPAGVGGEARHVSGESEGPQELRVRSECVPASTRQYLSVEPLVGENVRGVVEHLHQGPAVQTLQRSPTGKEGLTTLTIVHQ